MIFLTGCGFSHCQMCLAAGHGATVNLGEENYPHALMFGEDQARYIFTANEEWANYICMNAQGAGVQVRDLGLSAERISHLRDLFCCAGRYAPRP